MMTREEHLAAAASPSGSGSGSRAGSPRVRAPSRSSSPRTNAAAYKSGKANSRPGSSSSMRSGGALSPTVSRAPSQAR